jgi:hypothetical protein
MKNRFGNREVLCEGIGGFNRNIGGADGVRLTNVNSTKAADVSSISPLDAIRNALNSVRFEPGTAATIAAADFATGRIG